jgi:hypothetical protein
MIGESDMTNTVTIGVASREEVNARFMRAMTTGERTALLSALSMSGRYGAR